MLEAQGFERAAIAALGLSSARLQWLRVAANLLRWQVSLTGFDAWIDRAYRGGIRCLFAPAALAAMGALALVGLGAFVFELAAGRVALMPAALGGWPLVFLVVASIAAVALHEAGHAFTAKYFGCGVDRIGIGWYWLGPIALVDTSDMWLGTAKHASRSASPGSR